MSRRKWCATPIRLYCTTLKSIVTHAHKNGLISRDPFADCRVSGGTKEREFLTEEEVRTLMSHRFNDPAMTIVRDLFVFGCLTGISFIDIKNLTTDNLVTINGSLWYKSPFRQETEASFNVNTDRNLWFDYGLGRGGNIIALAQELYASGHVPYLLNRIAEQAPHVRLVSFSFRQQASEPSFQHLEVGELTHPALLRYLQERGINTALARLECKELHFIHNGKPYFAIGFPNVAGGFEVRNHFFKGCISPKDISHIRQLGEPREKCLVFEGMMDYLSFLTLRMRNCQTMPNLDRQDYVILNSVANVSKAIDVLHGYERIHCLLDNDGAGRNAYWELEREFAGRIRDFSHNYNGYKDLNDFLCGKRQILAVNPQPRAIVKPKKKGFGL